MKKIRLHPTIDRLLETFEYVAEFFAKLGEYLAEKLFDLFALAFAVLGVIVVAPIALDPERRAAFIANFLATTCQATNDCNLSHLLTGLAVALVILIGVIIFFIREISDTNPIFMDENPDQKFIDLLHSLELSDEDYSKLSNYIAAEFMEDKKPEAKDGLAAR